MLNNPHNQMEENMIELKEICFDNFWNVIELDVYDNQKDFVASNAISIAQSYVQPEYSPEAIYIDNQLVGFTMTGIDRDDHEYWIARLMIYKQFQGHGYGRQALEHIINKIKKDTSKHCIYLGVEPENHIAVKLYQDYGFECTGQICGHEQIMILKY